MNDSANTTRTIGLEETVSLLGVSSATVRNWVRHNYIVPENNPNGELLFDFLQITDLKHKITSGEIGRLSKRANKRQSSVQFIPEEYADSRDAVRLVKQIIDSQKTHILDVRHILSAVILNFLKTKGLASYIRPCSFDQITFHNAFLQNEVKWWFPSGGRAFEGAYLKLLDLDLPTTRDILGLVYQSLAVEGYKAQAGSYYTPKRIVDSIVDEHISADSVVLDPCCGTGQFLLAAADKVKDPTRIWGFDIDEIAVRLTRLTLLSQFPNHTFNPNVFCRNTLLGMDSEDLFSRIDLPHFDAIITNPPWGVHFSRLDTMALQRLYPSVRSNEAFSYFICKCIWLLKNNGVLSFILPESILNIKAHKDIRKVILEQSTIKSIKHLDRIFKNVFTPVIRLDVMKCAPQATDTFVVERNGATHPVQQRRLKDNPDYIFDVFSDDRDIAIFESIYRREHTSLKGNADWALGVVTGDNEKYLCDHESATNEPILTGKDIRRFLPLAAKAFIHFAPEKFQQVAPESKLRAKEKLIYKFISKELVFAYDDKQRLTLNSANILIPRVKNYPVKTILALFNSSLYQFLFQKKFGALKVLRGDLEKLPLPFLSKEAHEKIGHFVNQLLDQSLPSNERRRVYVDLDKYTMDVFALTDNEIDYIRRSAAVSSDFVL
jgi:predicted RNA methylase